VRRLQGGWLVWAAAIVPVMFILPLYVFPTAIGRPINTYDGRRLLEILWAAGLLFALVHTTFRASAWGTWGVLGRDVQAAVLVLVTWGWLSVALSSAPAYAIREWSLVTLLLVVLLPLSAVASAHRRKVLEITGLSLVLYAILIVATPLEHGFAHPRFLGQALAVLAPALLFSGSWVLALMAAPALAIGLLNGSRALMLTLVVVMVVAVVITPGRRRSMVPGVVGLALAVAIMAILAAMGHHESLQAAVERGTGTTGRINLWRETFQRFTEAPLLGLGPGMLARAPGIRNWGAHPHNTPLLVAAELGVVGLAALAWVVARGLARIPRLQPDRLPWALGVLGGGFHSLFSGTILMPASQAALVLALALALPGRPELALPPPRNRWGWLLPAAGAVALVLLLATLFLPPAEFIGRLQGPRFFSPGIIP
jgi:O-antigen ligase